MTSAPPHLRGLAQLVGASAAVDMLEEKIRAPTIWRQACSGLVTVDDIDEMLRSPDWTRRHLRLAKDGEPVPPREFEAADGRIDMRAAWDQFSAGASLILHRMERGLPILARLVREIARGVEGRAWVTGYVSPPKHGAFAVHADTHNVLVLQIGGTKKWTIEATVQDGVSGAELPQVCLMPGDILLVPQGVRHSAASEMGVSIHLSLGFRRHSWEELVASLLVGRYGSWKGAATRRDSKNFAADLDAVLQEIRQEVISREPVPEQSSVHTGPGLVDELQLATAGQTHAIRSLGSWQFAMTGDKLCVTNARYSISVSPVAKDFFERLSTGEDIGIAELTFRFEEDAWKPLLEGLVRGGFVALVEKPHI